MPIAVIWFSYNSAISSFLAIFLIHRICYDWKLVIVVEDGTVCSWFDWWYWSKSRSTILYVESIFKQTKLYVVCDGELASFDPNSRYEVCIAICLQPHTILDLLARHLISMERNICWFIANSMLIANLICHGCDLAKPICCDDRSVFRSERVQVVCLRNSTMIGTDFILVRNQIIKLRWVQLLDFVAKWTHDAGWIFRNGLFTSCVLGWNVSCKMSCSFVIHKGVWCSFA